MTMRSDFRIFHDADNGNLINQMASSQEYFFSTCARLFERMINTVPKTVTLTSVIDPIPLKPRRVSLRLEGGLISASGEIRVREFSCQ